MDTQTGERTPENQNKRSSPKFSLRPYLGRLAVIFILATVVSAAFNELTYNMQKDEYDRAPRTIELIIPAGTAQRIADGVEPGLPGSLTFVVGDTLQVKNEDSEAHQLGPVFVPPGTTGSISFDQADTLSYDCSFRSNRYLGVDVRAATTWVTRIQALLLAAPTTGVLIFLYSLLVWPIKPQDKGRGNPVAGAPAA